MKILTFLLLVVLSTLMGCRSSDSNSTKYDLQGEIMGIDSGRIVLSYWTGNESIFDTTLIKEGKFSFAGSISEPMRCLLTLENKTIGFFIEPQIMLIKLDKDSIYDFQMEGSKTQDEAEMVENILKPLTEKIYSLRKTKGDIQDSISKTINNSNKLLLQKKADQIDNSIINTINQIDSIEVRFATDNPKSFYAAYTLRILNNNETIPLDSVKSIFNRMDSSVKESVDGKDIAEIIKKRDNIRIGNQAPDFKATNINQQKVILSEFQGKSVVLLDFWASWCNPCRESIPHLKTVYSKYHSKGFEIIAVTLDDNKKAWADAVKQNNIEMWHHIPVAEKWPCRSDQLSPDDIYSNYFVTAIPVQLLITKDGKIIYRNMGHSEESEKLLDEQLSQIFDN